MGSLASNTERSRGFQMESAQSPISFPRQFAPHFSYAAATMATSVELTVRESRSSLMRSVRLSKRPSQVMTAPDGEIHGCFSRRDSSVVWKARYRILMPPFEYDSLLSGP